MLNDKVSIITGASSGIGAALATLLANEGSLVVLCARRTHMLQNVAARIRNAGGTCVTIQCDVTNRDAADEMINSMFKLNVFSLWYTTRPAVYYMKKQKSGHIINIASMAGKLGYPYNSAYVAAKHACVGFTHALRLELAETNVHASVVCPAGVLTDWASMTEGGSMLPMFSESGSIIKKTAIERNVSLPTIEGVKSAEEVARVIIECLYNPVAEVYTHAGSKEFVVLATQDLETAEQQQIPIALGEREVYERLKNSGSHQAP